MSAKPIRGRASWHCVSGRDPGGATHECFAKLGDSVYFQDDEGLFVNLFVPSTLDWRERGVTLEQRTRFPEEETTRLVVRTKEPQRFALRVRIPGWSRGTQASLNGRPLEALASPGSYLVLDRARYHNAVVKNLHAQNVCAIVELEEIAVKTTNAFNEQYNIWISDGHIRKGPRAHITTCFPATF